MTSKQLERFLQRGTGDRRDFFDTSAVTSDWEKAQKDKMLGRAPVTEMDRVADQWAIANGRRPPSRGQIKAVLENKRDR